MKFYVYNDRWPVRSSWEISSKISLNSARVGGRSLFLIHPYGNGFVMAIPYWLSLSILKILDEILFVCFLPSIVKSNTIFSFLFSSINTSVSKASLVFTQLNPPISVFSNTLTYSASVRRTIQHLLLFLWTQPLKLPAELHLREWYLKISCSREDLC